MPKNDTIFQRLKLATKAEREELCKILGLDKEYSNEFESISKELRSVSGYSVENAFRDDHALEYEIILRDIYTALSFNIKNFNIKKYMELKKTNLSENDLEKRIENLFESIYKSVEKNNKNNPSEEFRKTIESKGNHLRWLKAAIGSKGHDPLSKKPSSILVAVATSITSGATTPSYGKTFLVVAKLIDIKKRIRAEQILKGTK